MLLGHFVAVEAVGEDRMGMGPPRARISRAISSVYTNDRILEDISYSRISEDISGNILSLHK